jgi:glycosyltransferase involved in cell wall biosynthesis
MRKKILFVTTRLFWPTDSGRKLSLYYYCKGLHEQYDCDIYLYSFFEAGQTVKDIDHKPDFIKEVYPARSISRREKVQNLLSKTLSGDWPIQCSLFYSRENAEHLARYCSLVKPDFIFVDMIRTAMYYESFQGSRALKVLDMDDLLSKRYARQLNSKYGGNIAGQYGNRLPGFIKRLIALPCVRRQILQKEKELTEKAEIAYAKLYDKVIFVSDEETDLMNRQLPGKAMTVPVGILDPGSPSGNELAPTRDLLSFVGNLNVAANIDSLQWIVRDIIPKVQHDVTFMVIGKCPEYVRNLYKGNPKVVFTGRVDDLAEYVRKSQIFLSPLLYGTGIKTKILEAMSFGVPVVTNDVGAEGIKVTNGRELWIENEDLKIAKRVDYLLDHYDLAREVADRGRQLVIQKYEWSQIWLEFQSLFAD